MRKWKKIRDRDAEGETSYLDELIGEEEQKKRKETEAQMVNPPTLMLS